MGKGKNTKQPGPILGFGIAGWGLLIRRFMPLLGLGRRSRACDLLEHLGTWPLTAQSSLAVVRVHNETLVLGITPQNVTLLTKMAGPASAEAGASHQNGSVVEFDEVNAPSAYFTAEMKPQA